jgi:signal transduction histidine kinase
VFTAGLTVVAAVFVLQGAIAFFLTHRSEAEARKIFDDSVDSVVEISRIARDVDRERILVDDHVFEKEVAGMTAVEEKLAAVAEDIQSAKKADTPLIDQPTEAELWQLAQISLARFEQIVGEALAFSRNNMPTEARARMESALGDYDSLSRRLDDLIALNRTGADEAMGSVRALERRTENAQIATRLVGLALVLLIGWWGTRQITRYEKQVGSYAAELEQRNRDLDAFAGRVAHDLKNALGPVVMSPGMLRRASDDPQRVLEIADRTERCSLRATAVIDALLAFSRASRLSEEGESGALRTAVRDVVDELAPLVAQLDVSVRVDDIPDVYVACHPGLLHILLANLCGNAVKFLEGQRERLVRISARVEGSSCRIEVEDTGPGIPSAAQSRLFEPFYRVEGTRAPGTGIGLATARRIVDSRDGHIAVNSTVGRGSRFVVWLPVTEPPEDRTPKAESDETRPSVRE